MDSLILVTAIGLIFVFATFAALTSVVTEGIARFLGLRGEYLLRGIRSLVDNGHDFSLFAKDAPSSSAPAVGGVSAFDPSKAVTPQLLNLTFLSSYADKAAMIAGAGDRDLTNAERRKLPSYISGRAFARAVTDLVIPDESGDTTMAKVRDGIDKLAPGPLKDYLTQLASTVSDDLGKFRKGIEEWYDDQMDRVSGWYKRHVRWISLAIGAAIVLLFNVSAIHIATSLYTDEALRGAVLTEAVSAANCSGKEADVCLAEIRGEIATARSAGLPIGWGPVAECAQPGSDCSVLDNLGLTDPLHGGFGADLWYFVLLLLGWAVMVLALLPGARFWFDILGRLGSLRSTGPKPASS